MKIGFDVSGGAPGNPYALQEATASGFDAVEASFHQEHDEEGLHTKPFQELEVDGATVLSGGVAVAEGFQFTGRYDRTLTGNTHNLKQSDGRAITAGTIRLQAASPVDLSGLVPPSESEHIKILENGGNETITLLHNNSGSDAANRFSNPSARDVRLASGEILLLKYDTSSGIWRMLVSGGQAVINSRQQGTFTIPGSDASDTQTITAVDPDKCDVSLLGAYYATGASVQHVAPGVTLLLTDATTLTATRTGGTLGAGEEVTVAYQVLEYV